MMVIVVERVSPGLRGELTRWLLEPHTGVFIGRVSALVRDKLWDYVCSQTGVGAAFLAHNSDNEQGFSMRSHGDLRRSLVDFEGLSLVQIPS